MPVRDPEHGHDDALRRTARWSRVTYAVEPIDADSSLATFSAKGTFTGPLRIPNLILPALGRAETRKNLASLKHRIDAGIPPRSTVPTPAS